MLRETATADAIATWADMIRDTMAGASGLEESLIQTAAVAPAAIKPQLETFAHRLRHQPLEVALDALATDLNHSSADLIVAALAAAARLEARDLGSLLARLAEAIRGDVRMRTRIEIGRARIRTSARIAVATTTATVVFLFVFARHLLEPYDTAAGQGWLVVVMAVFFGAGVMLHHYSQLEAPRALHAPSHLTSGAGPMTALAVMVAGAGIGLGVFLAVRAVFPRPVPLQRALADLGRPRRALVESETTSTTRMSNRIGRATISLFEATGLVDLGGLRQRLRALGKPVEVHAYEKMLGGLAGFFLPLGFAAILAAGGVTVPVGWVAVLAVGLGIGGFVWPDLGLSERIERRRRDFRHSLSAYLDLVTIILAGGGGLETALQTSADLGDGWAFTEIRSALRKARLTNRTPWEVFDDLGTELGVDELRELAASAHLAGDQGARIRASLAAKADSMRDSRDRRHRSPSRSRHREDAPAGRHPGRRHDPVHRLRRRPSDLHAGDSPMTPAKGNHMPRHHLTIRYWKGATDMTAYIDYTRLLIEVGLSRLGVQVRDERGAMSTEAAVLTGVLVTIAVAAGVILIAKMRSNAEAIPDNVPTP